MSPMHPKLRIALLREKPKTENGTTYKLTSTLLLYFEGLITKRFYLEKYQRPESSPNSPNQISSRQLSTLDQEISTFQNRYMPNYKWIQQKWVKNQKLQLKKDPFSVNPLAIVTNSFVVVGKWIPLIVLRRLPFFRKLQIFVSRKISQFRDRKKR